MINAQNLANNIMNERTTNAYSLVDVRYVELNNCFLLHIAAVMPKGIDTYYQGIYLVKNNNTIVLYSNEQYVDLKGHELSSRIDNMMSTKDIKTTAKTAIHNMFQND